MISILLVLPLSLSIYLFWIAKLTDTSFTVLLMFFIATILFVLLFRSIGKFSVGPEGVKFEKSAEHNFVPAQDKAAEQFARN